MKLNAILKLKNESSIDECSECKGKVFDYLETEYYLIICDVYYRDMQPDTDG